MTDSIAALDYNSMLVRFNEFIVKNDRPLGMVHFTVTMGHKGGIGPFAPNIFRCKGLEGIGELKIWGD